MIDIHSHILPAVDDGAVDLDMALDMASLYVENGFKQVICTPHFMEDLDNFLPEENQKILNKLNEEISKAGLDLNLYLGNEVYISLSLLEDLHKGKFSTLNNSKYILIELPMFNIPLYTEDILYELQVRDYIPIIAHPERNSKIIKDPNILYNFVKDGALAQLNLPSLKGTYGDEIKDTTKVLLQHKLFHFVGTDAHSNGRLSPKVASVLKNLKDLVDEDYFHQLTKLNAKLLLENKDIIKSEPRKIEKKQGFFRRLFR